MANEERREKPFSGHLLDDVTEGTHGLTVRTGETDESVGEGANDFFDTAPGSFNDPKKFAVPVSTVLRAVKEDRQTQIQKLFNSVKGKIKSVVYQELLVYLSYIQDEADISQRLLVLMDLKSIITAAQSMHNKGFTDEEWLANTKLPEFLKEVTADEFDFLFAVLVMVQREIDLLPVFIDALMSLAEPTDPTAENVQAIEPVVSTVTEALATVVDQPPPLPSVPVPSFVSVELARRMAALEARMRSLVDQYYALESKQGVMNSSLANVTMQLPDFEAAERRVTDLTRRLGDIPAISTVAYVEGLLRELQATLSRLPEAAALTARVDELQALVGQVELQSQKIEQVHQALARTADAAKVDNFIYQVFEPFKKWVEQNVQLSRVSDGRPSNSQSPQSKPKMAISVSDWIWISVAVLAAILYFM